MFCRPSDIAHALVSDFPIFEIAECASKWSPRESYISPRADGAPFGGLVMISDTRLSCALHTLHRARMIEDMDQRAGTFAALRGIVFCTIDMLNRGDGIHDAALAGAVRSYFSRCLQTEANQGAGCGADDEIVTPKQPKLRAYTPLSLLADSIVLEDSRRPKGAEIFPRFHRLMGAAGDPDTKIKNEAARIIRADLERPLADRARHAGAGQFVNVALGLLAEVTTRHFPSGDLGQDHDRSIAQSPRARRAS